MHTFTRLSLSRQFLVASFPILLMGMVAVGWWVGKKIEHGVLYRLGSVTSHYVESFVSPHLQSLAHQSHLAEADQVALNALLTDTPLGQRIVSFKIWDRTGRIVYSTDSSLNGRSFPIGEGLSAALNGIVHSEVSHLTEAENVSESGKWLSLLETYSPIHADRLGTVIAAAEFYQTPHELFGEIRRAQLHSWGVVAAVMLAMYLLIFDIVRRGSHTIDAQQRELNEQVTRLSAVVKQNAQLHDRVRRAVARTTALNERFLRRISSDLHDGPGQDLALALMRFETIAGTGTHCTACSAVHGYTEHNTRAIYTSLQSALAELRAISQGLQLPEIEPLHSTEVAERAVRDFSRKTGTRVALATPGDSINVALPVKITLYRLIQESLANGFRHGGGAMQSVSVERADDQLVITVRDDGVGFDPDTPPAEGSTGLEGMRERVEILGGTFHLKTARGEGTVIQASLPLRVAGFDNE